ncbi:MAG: sensor histidine kinase [Bacteroidia bacterium]|nr:sensor histidine kinase [Bacteroidia bacterium]
MNKGVFIAFLLIFSGSFLQSQDCDYLKRSYEQIRDNDKSDIEKLEQISNVLNSTLDIQSCTSELASLYRIKGFCELRLNQSEFAEFSYRTSLKFAIKSSDTNSIGLAYNNLGKIHIRQNTTDSAVYYFHKAHKMFSKIDDDFGLMLTYQNLSVVYYYLDSLSWARQNAYRLLEKASILNDQEGLATGQQILNLVELEVDGIGDSTFYYYRKSLSVFKKINDHESVMNIYENIGSSYESTETYDSAIYYYKKASVIADSLNSAHLLSYMNAKVTDIGALLQEKNKNKLLLINILVGLFAILIVAVIVIIHIRRKNIIIKDNRIQELLSTQEIRTFESMIQGQDNERKRIADELHDRIGAMLSTIKLYHSQIDSSIKTLDDKTNSQHEKAGSLIDETVQELRRISHDLHSGILVKFGLKAALEQLADALSTLNKPKFNWYFNNVDRRFNSELEINLYRVIQEAISNIIKHADANSVNIQLNLIDEDLLVTIEDDGRGFDKRMKRGDGIGMESMNSRVEKMNGNFNIDTSLGHGTTLIIEIPAHD